MQTSLDTKHLLNRGNSYSLRYVIPEQLRRHHGGAGNSLRPSGPPARGLLSCAGMKP